MLKVLTTIATVGFALAQKGAIKVNPESRLMEDAHNRSVLFHGVNVVYKVDPYIPSNDKFDPQLSMTDEDIDNLVKWGFNFVRLGVMWEAVERSPDVFNHTYLQEVEKLVNKMGEKGIYTLVDAHQDVFARHICGEGVPDFYASDDILDHKCTGGLIPWIATLIGACKSIKDYGFRFDQNGDPLIEDCQKNNFAGYYPSPESVSGFNRLYENIGGLQDKFINYWEYVSQYFANNQYVLGYDPINEPFPSNILTEPSLVYHPGKFDEEKLQPLYKRAYEKYYKADKSKIMFFESAEFPDEIGILGGFVFHLGFTEPPGGANNLTTQVLNDHSYCCQLSSDICATGEPSLDKAKECRDWHEDRINTRSEDAQKYGIPLFISEFGACLNSSSCVQEIKSLTDVCDEHLVGWAYWQYKNFADLTTSAGTASEGFFNNDGTLQDAKVKALARTYLQSTQGVLKSMNFNTENADFSASFVADTSITQPTVIYWSQEFWYPQGFSMKLTDSKGQVLALDTDYKLDQSTPNYTKVQIINSALNQQLISLTLHAKYIEAVSVQALIQ